MFSNVDAYMLLSDANRFYFTHLTMSSGCVILTKYEKVLITDFRYYAMASSSLKDYTVVQCSGPLLDEIAFQMKRLDVKTVGYEEEFLSVALFKKLTTAMDKLEFVPISEKINTLRAIKTEDEIRCLAAAQVVAQKALVKVIDGLKVGVTEREVAAQLLYEMQLGGAEDMSFDTIVAFNQNSAMPHYRTGNRRLEKNDIILIDMGAKMNGYCSDMTRTFSLGTVTDKLAELHSLVLEAQTIALKGIKAGMTAREADALAREYFKANGYEKEFGHSLGHGVGIDIHEFPSLSAKSETVLKPNMVVTIEPGLYIDGIGGVRIEDMIVITENGCLNLTNMDKRLNIKQ